MNISAILSHCKTNCDFFFFSSNTCKNIQTTHELTQKLCGFHLNSFVSPVRKCVLNLSLCNYCLELTHLSSKTVACRKIIQSLIKNSWTEPQSFMELPLHINKILWDVQLSSSASSVLATVYILFLSLPGSWD